MTEIFPNQECCNRIFLLVYILLFAFLHICQILKFKKQIQANTILEKYGWKIMVVRALLQSIITSKKPSSLEVYNTIWDEEGISSKLFMWSKLHIFVYFGNNDIWQTMFVRKYKHWSNLLLSNQARRSYIWTENKGVP